MPIRSTFSSANTKVRIVQLDKPFPRFGIGNIQIGGGECFRYTYMDKMKYPWTFFERYTFHRLVSIYTHKNLEEHERNFIDKWYEIEAGKYGY